MAAGTMDTLPCQRAYVKAMAQGRTAEMTEKARQEDKASHALLNRLRSCGANAECFDCTATKPGWAVLPWGTFVCIDCAQVHRNLGRHVSQTKAINTGTYLWFPHEIAVMREIGNARAQRAFSGAPAKPSRDAPAATKAEHARQKYELRRWGPAYSEEVAPPSVTTAPPPPAKAAEAQLATAVPKRSKPTSGLSQARRHTPGPKESVVADLISLDDLEEPSAAVPAAAPASSDSWAAFADFGDFTGVRAPDGVAPAGVIAGAPDTARAPTAAWDQKKAAVLSLFPGNAPPTPSSCHFQGQQLQPFAGGHAFFAAYGL